MHQLSNQGVKVVAKSDCALLSNKIFNAELQPGLDLLYSNELGQLKSIKKRACATLPKPNKSLLLSAESLNL